MEERIKYGMSRFWKDILWLLFFIGLFLISIFGLGFFPEDTFYATLLFWVGRFLLGMMLIMQLLMIQEEIGEECGISYKIIESDRTWAPFKAKVFRPRALFIFWWWAPMKTKSHFWEGKNFFGGPTYGGWTEEIDFKTENKAREAIEEYKKNSRSTRSDYMKKRKKKIQRKIKI